MENTTQGKKPAEWFKMLKEPYSSEAIANIDEKAHFYEKYPESLVNAIVFSFHWNSTSQGFEYWEKLKDSIQSGETTYLETETELKPQDEKKEVESELKEGEVYFWTDDEKYYRTGNLEFAIQRSEINSTIYKGIPIGTKQTKSILEPIKTK